MRAWSLHQMYLDNVAAARCYNETLQGLAVFEGKTKMYRNHPQLKRFRSKSDFIIYLRHLYNDHNIRMAKYPKAKLKEWRLPPGDCDDVSVEPIPISEAQLLYEAAHLLSKYERRSRRFGHYLTSEILRLERSLEQRSVVPHVLFAPAGEFLGVVASWERPKPEAIEILKRYNLEGIVC